MMKNQTNKQLSARFRYIRWWVILPLAFILFTQKDWWPYIEDWRCGCIAAKLRSQYSLVVRFGDPSEFYLQPLPPVTDSPGRNISIEPVQPHSALTALQGIRRALSKYPEDLILKYLEAIFIGGSLRHHGTKIGGTYFHSWIFLSAIPDFEDRGVALYEKCVHHELSSLLADGAPFPYNQWCAVNEPDFEYRSSDAMDMARSAAPESCLRAENAPFWHMAGFVNEYGMSDVENDINTYAELAMSQPGTLKQLTDQYPRIKAKTKILVDFYRGLAPELGRYFETAGLIESQGNGPYLHRPRK